MRVFLGLGSNIGNRFKNLQFAIEQMLLNNIKIIAKSNIYETLPMYNTKQDNFLNQVIEIETTMLSEKLLGLLKSIESKCGREIDAPRNTPRPLDIDILSYGDKIVNLDKLQIPHIKIKERDFVLRPWSELSPNFIIPGECESVLELLDNITESTILGKYYQDKMEKQI
ncbi:MAG: 2-amino-4-hydroxy-6-hydroxymethyldihydropteridine diphosphokinase [Candidatus Marinimicrobia bacterium]|nr:2-amino-4-hydroxy-6-hydroxymethyldihydropteridine diphosphokinase [Candidatus Neomarinimicrobiota bacterium]MBL7023607.1 2-amino-4-hydroxy-6-hydroxymethyldihydropteridine diphosphokinase [Candidatus Neomarinimicrobiota bacterium]MBL7109895.1 2-amino-4-hydroxy-6-hydroxymethyldihydropteridine diphosphokinase [Candidatus Neomarinimicrobiota bacterium]